VQQTATTIDDAVRELPDANLVSSRKYSITSLIHLVTSACCIVFQLSSAFMGEFILTLFSRNEPRHYYHYSAMSQDNIQLF